ncbi:hypothetical protein [Pelagicoccus sp. SDUM812005]|uniref:hypothetical protein n=1 Tax=Pelagicoccus sp. SDUM812005 TaxID=3041257 RepID=UPI00280F3F58|nr:hypothetical protein [Pelagicoccus sp. SDUM812005]MDQ8181967.1 hypothetical protein [Pelagicoccus sp. SDUM812005]
MLELFLEVIAEIFLQVVVEILADCGIHVFKRKPVQNPIPAAIGYFLFGCLAGGLSLLIFEGSFISDPRLKIANLILAPLVAGLAMAWIGKRRRRGGKDSVRIERFCYGFLFAFGVALIRFVWAT